MKNVRVYAPFILGALLLQSVVESRAAVPVRQGAYGQAEWVDTLTNKKMVTEIAFFTPRIVNIRKYPLGGNVKKQNLVVRLEKQNVEVTQTEETGYTTLSSSEVTVRYYHNTGAIAFYDKDGRLMLREKSGSTTLTARKDGDFSSYKVQQSFTLKNGEKIFGLGQLQNGNLNQRGQTYNYMIEGNTSVWIPYVHSINGYALYWDNASPTTFSDNTTSCMTFESAVGYGVDYFFLAGSSTDGNQQVADMRELTGQVPMIPLWAYGYFQSKERYTSANETMGVMQKYRKLRVPLDCVVQDWQYWGDNNMWNALEFSNPSFANYQQMIDSLHANKAHMIISTWANFGPDTKPYAELKATGHLITQHGKPMTTTYPGNSGVSVYDPYSTEARDIYWRHLYGNIISKGVDGYWLDSSEPDHYQGGTEMEETFDYVTGLGCTWRSVRNAFPLVHVGGVYDHHRAQGDLRKRCIILTRSAYAGIQRTGSNTWSGDVTASWQTLKNQIPAALNFTMCGIPSWNSDLGAFFNGNLGGPGNKEYNELYLRWLQFGTFTPMMRSHGSGTDKAIYVFGDRGTPNFDVIEKYIKMRYHLLPYIYSTAWEVHSEARSFMNALALEYPQDVSGSTVKDEYLFGRSILVAPVTDYQVAQRRVYLPMGNEWVDFWTGDRYAGGKYVRKDVNIETMPLYLKAGTILPWARKNLYADIQKWDTLQIRIYPGADGAFRLYEDEGDNYNYELGKYSTIDFQWDDAQRQLRVSARRGSFEGMNKQRVFDIVVVENGRGVGEELSSCVDYRLLYDGGQATVNLANSQNVEVDYADETETAQLDIPGKPYEFKASDWVTGDPGRVSQSDISYNRANNTITVRASGPQNTALQLDNSLSEAYYIPRGKSFLCVTATNVSTDPTAHQLWFHAGSWLGTVPASRVIRQGTNYVVVWDLSESISEYASKSLVTNGSFITCLGMTSTTGVSVVSDIGYYTASEVDHVSTGIDGLRTDHRQETSPAYLLNGTSVSANDIQNSLYKGQILVSKHKKVLMK